VTRQEYVVVAGASWRLLCRATLLGPVAVALLLAVVTVPALDDGYAMTVLRTVGLLLACAWVVTTDDPSGEVLAASPYPTRVRTAARAATGLFAVLPVWLLAAALVELRAPETPVFGVGLESLALGVVGLGLGAGFRAFRGQHAPSYVAILSLVVVAFLTNGLPRWYAMQQSQTWGPPWQAAQIRWAALAIVAAGLLGLALRDPLGRRRR
jgi:hypothetical protein